MPAEEQWIVGGGGGHCCARCTWRCCCPCCCYCCCCPPPASSCRCKPGSAARCTIPHLAPHAVLELSVRLLRTQHEARPVLLHLPVLPRPCRCPRCLGCCCLGCAAAGLGVRGGSGGSGGGAGSGGTAPLAARARAPACHLPAAPTTLGTAIAAVPAAHAPIPAPATAHVCWRLSQGAAAVEQQRHVEQGGVCRNACTAMLLLLLLQLLLACYVGGHLHRLLQAPRCPQPALEQAERPCCSAGAQAAPHCRCCCCCRCCRFQRGVQGGAAVRVEAVQALQALSRHEGGP